MKKAAEASGIGVWGLCREDVVAHASDVGWKSRLWALMFNRGLQMLICHRLAVAVMAVPKGTVLSAILSWWLQQIFACDLNPTARIGRRVRFPHAIGIVIGSGAIIGDDTRIYQNVTVGAGRANVHGRNYPELGMGVTVYAGSVLVGGIKIGDGAVIGASSFVNRDIPSGAVACGIPAKARP